MTFLTGLVPREFTGPNSGAAEDYFKGTDGAYYYYKVNVDPEDESLTIVDTADRYMPVDFDSLAGLANILNKIVRFNKQKVLFDEINLAELLQGASI